MGAWHQGVCSQWDGSTNLGTNTVSLGCTVIMKHGGGASGGQVSFPADVKQELSEQR